MCPETRITNNTTVIPVLETIKMSNHSSHFPTQQFTDGLYSALQYSALILLLRQSKCPITALISQHFTDSGLYFALQYKKMHWLEMRK